MRPIALTIAGSDCSGGAGIQADLKTFHRFGAYGASALALVTVQNTQGVSAVHLLPPDLVAAQVEAVASDLPVGATKTGALGSAAIIEAVADAAGRLPLGPLVVDPVMISKHGHPLVADDAVAALRGRLLPRAALVTPNLHEAAALTGLAVTDEAAMRDAARALRDLGAGAVLVKGGSLPGDETIDLLWDGRTFLRLAGPRIATRHTHGTGCTYSAAIAALLAAGTPLDDAVRRAHAFLRRAIGSAPGLGHGAGPVDHFASIDL